MDAPYPLKNPPKHPGIYLLFSPTTQQRYVGKTVNLCVRYTEWKGVVTSGLGHRNLRLKQAVEQCNDWGFYILRELPNASSEELARIEGEEIRSAQAEHGELLLNVITPGGKVESLGATNPKTAIIGLEGDRISLRTAADFLDCSVNTLQKRLSNMRRKHGTTEVTLAELQLMSSRFREK